MNRWLLFSILALAAGACQADPHASATVLEGWTDVPVPRGFHLVESRPSEAAVSAGEYRSGEFLFEGRGSKASVQQYYRDRLPLHGWSLDASGAGWVKGPSRLHIVLNDLPVSAYASDYGMIRYQLRIRSERLPLTEE